MIKPELRTQKIVLLFTLIFFVFASITGLYVYNKYPGWVQNPRRSVVRLVNEWAGSFFGTGKPAHHNIVVRDAYALHLKAGKQYGWPPIKTKDEIRKLKQKKLLVPISDDDGYCISKFSSSSPVLTRSAHSVLRTIGQRFAKEAGDGNYFTVTSFTRTVKQQKHLCAVNKAATKGISSHSYGCSFDISYNRFNGKRGGNPTLQRILERILIDLRNEKRLLLIAETSSHCYHITVSRKL